MLQSINAKLPDVVAKTDAAEREKMVAASAVSDIFDEQVKGRYVDLLQAAEKEGLIDSFSGDLSQAFGSWPGDEETRKKIIDKMVADAFGYMGENPHVFLERKNLVGIEDDIYFLKEIQEKYGTAPISEEEVKKLLQQIEERS